MARSKIEHLTAKEETVKFGKKEFTVEPMTNRELFEFAEKLEDKWNELIKDDTELTLENIIKIVRQEPVELINEVVKEDFTEDDFLDAYPNDIYNLFRVFKEINFTFVNAISSPVQRVIQFLTSNQQEIQNKLENQQ
jgi:hypothetical protein